MQGTIYENETPEKEVTTENPPEEEKEIKFKSEGKLSPYIEKFLEGYEASLSSKRDSEGATLKVSEVLGGLARLYEKVRTTVEYKGDHVLRRNAIERILKRRVWQEGSVVANINEEKLAESLCKELIWARYLPNDSVTGSKIKHVANVVAKYLYLFRNLDSIPPEFSATKVRTWIWGVASSEIEDVLDPSHKDLYIDLMFDWFNNHFKWSDAEIPEHEKNTQIYLAIHRAHTKSDEPIMRYHLLLKEVKNWEKAGKEEVNKFIVDFPKVYLEIEKHLNYSGRFSLYRRIQKYSAAFDIFLDIATSEKTGLRKLLEDTEKFEEKVREVCELRYGQIRQKVNTGIVRSIIYIFLTKVLFAMLIEIPYEIYFYNEVRYLPLSINILFPPFMMWIIGMSTSIPGAKNTEAIIKRLKTVIYPIADSNPHGFSVVSSSKNNALASIFGLVYLFIFLLVFGGITYLLTLLNFSLSGILIFFFFLSLVILFGFRVRFNAVQLKIESDNESFFNHLGSYLMLPFLNFGFFLSKGLAKINFLSVFLDFIIEAPLKSIIEVFEEWTSYIREKREEIVELPNN